MEAVLFAAGRGTRLGPATRDVPKALVDVAGRPLIEHVLGRLAAAGIGRAVVNVHHHADRLRAWAASWRGRPEVLLSHEVGEPLETGGGLARARHLLAGEGPLLLHNVDVLTPLDLGAVLRAHAASDALATLVVSARASTRGLLFDAQGLLGRVDEGRGLVERVRTPEGTERRRAFQGIHVLAPRFLDRLGPPRVVSIVTPWLAAAREGERLLPYDMDPVPWIDVGRPADLERARSDPTFVT